MKSPPELPARAAAMEEEEAQVYLNFDVFAFNEERKKTLGGEVFIKFGLRLVFFCWVFFLVSGCSEIPRYFNFFL